MSADQTNPMSEQRLAEILARATAATPGRWKSDGAEIYGTLGDVLMIDLWVGETLDINDQEQSNANAAFVAAARTDVPELVAEVQRLRAQVAGLKGQAEKVAEFCAQRAEYITSILNCHPDNAHDYYRWQGHAESRRQLSARIGLPVAWPAKSKPAPAACEACGDLPEQWCPDCGSCKAGCFEGHVDNSCTHSNAPWAVSRG